MEHIFFAEIKKLMCLIVVFFGEKKSFSSGGSSFNFGTFP